MSTNRPPGAQDGEGRLAHAFSTELRFSDLSILLSDASLLSVPPAVADAG